MSIATEIHRREPGRNRGAERCRIRAAVAQRNHIGVAIRAFPGLDRPFFTAGIGGRETKPGPVRKAIRSGLGSPSRNCQLPNSSYKDRR